MLRTLKQQDAAGTLAASTDPTAGWPIKGAKIDSSGLEWEMKEVLAAYYCDINGGGCDISDRIQSTIDINTGPTVTRIRHSTSWFPEGGELQNPHFDLHAVCSGVDCGDVAPSHNILTNGTRETIYRECPIKGVSDPA